MEKAILLLASDKNDKVAWSGTNYNIYSSLAKKFDIEFIKYFTNKVFFAYLVDSIYFLFFKLFRKTSIHEHTLFYNKSIIRKLVKKISKLDCEYVFTTLSYVVPFIKNKKIIYITDATFKSMYGYYWFNINKYDLNKIELMQQLAIKNSYKIVLSSQWGVDCAIKDYNIKSDKIILALFGANISKPSKTVLRKNLSRPIKLLFCGVDEKRKGLAEAIDITNKLNDFGIDTVLNVVGLKKDNSRYVKYFGRLSKNNTDEFEMIKHLYSDSDLLILPTKAECSAIVYCEACLYGLPIISTKTGGVQSYVIDNYNGKTFEINDKFCTNVVNYITKLIKEKGLYAKLSHNALKYSENSLNWESWANSIMKGL